MNQKVNFNGKTVEVELKKGEYIAWTYGDNDCRPFKTKKEAVEDRNNNLKSLYASIAELDRLIPVYQFIFVESCGMEENVPVYSIEERVKEQSAK